MENNNGIDSKKTHRKRLSGRKADKRKEKNKHVQELTGNQRNPKAFSYHSVVKAQRTIARSQDIKAKKHHIPVVNRTPLEPPPVLVAVVGGCQVGKTTLIRSLIKNYTRQKLTNINGPVTIVSGKKQRLTFIEVKNDINCMVDIAKVADVVLMLIDITLGIEMEVFEFLEICRAYGMPRIMGILNHLDLMKTGKSMRKRKKELTHRFQVELYPGAKLFYLSGVTHGEYMKNEISNLGRFISVLKFRPLQFRATHSYVLVDRMEDITNAELIRQKPLCQRQIVLYGYVRGIPMQPKQTVHIPGVGDFTIKETTMIDDPCPLPEKLKKRSLNAKERLMYAPMSGVAGVVYDKDAIYIDLGGSHHGRQKKESKLEEGEVDMMQNLVQLQSTANDKTSQSQLLIYTNSQMINNEAESDSDETDSEGESDDLSDNEEDRNKPKFESFCDSNGIFRRRAVFSDTLDVGDSDSESGIESAGEMIDDDECDLFSPPGKKMKFEKDFENFSKSENSAEDNMPGISKKASISTKGYITFLQNHIYGQDTGPTKSVSIVKESEPNNKLISDLFMPVDKDSCERSLKLPSNVNLNGLDTCRVLDVKLDWTDEETLDTIRDCFMTGEWSEKEGAAEKLLKLDAEDEDLYGDFEDLEKGEVEKITDSSGEDKGKKKEEEKKKKKADKNANEKRMEKKLKLKQMFDSEFDENKNGNLDSFDALKEELNEQANLNRTQFEGLDDATRIKYEGFRAGLYVRMELENVDHRLVTNFDHSYPLIVGSLLDSELNMGYVRVRLKVHRWFPRILKNRDPLYLSLGWRRFQTKMFYAKREDNFRLRSLKYARKYLHVEALFWGPIPETSSGFVGFQNINTTTADFSIAVNGVVLEADKTTQLVKKLKFIGHPEKIHQKTAFVKDMFHLDEVAKYEGAKVQTQSKIRGVIKKSVGSEGQVRVTFEDQIKMSDKVILNTWVQIEIPKRCEVVQNLLLPVDRKRECQGSMKTNAQIKRENGIRNLPDPDSLYTEIKERREYVRLPLKIPRKLQASLPYKYKPKITPKQNKPDRVLIVKDSEEVKMMNFMSQLKTVMRNKSFQQLKEKQKKKKEYKKDIRSREAMKQMRVKKRKAYACSRKSNKTNKS